MYLTTHHTITVIIIMTTIITIIHLFIYVINNDVHFFFLNC